MTEPVMPVECGLNQTQSLGLESLTSPPARRVAHPSSRAGRQLHLGLSRTAYPCPSLYYSLLTQQTQGSLDSVSYFGKLTEPKEKATESTVYGRGHKSMFTTEV